MRLQRTKMGYYLKGLRYNEISASAVGVNVMGYRLIALCVSAFFTSIGGTFYSQIVGYLEPNSAINIEIVIELIMFTVIGGFGTVWGPVVGTAFLFPLGEIVRSHWPGFHLILFGLVVITFILISPEGIVHIFRRNKNHSKMLQGKGYSFHKLRTP
jgi:branched-chain amino acid transport system permease protein